MDRSIEHTAIIENIDGQIVDLVMQVEGACQSCKAQKLCGMGDAGEKRLSVHAPDAGDFEVGGQVIVSISPSMGVNAVAVSYIYPFLVMLGTLLALTGLGATELTAGLSALGALVVYFLVIRIFRKKLDRAVEFKIRKA